GNPAPMIIGCPTVRCAQAIQVAIIGSPEGLVSQHRCLTSFGAFSELGDVKIVWPAVESRRPALHHPRRSESNDSRCHGAKALSSGLGGVLARCLPDSLRGTPPRARGCGASLSQ